jgi:hypothetical protein
VVLVVPPIHARGRFANSFKATCVISRFEHVAVHADDCGTIVPKSRKNRAPFPGLFKTTGSFALPGRPSGSFRIGSMLPFATQRHHLGARLASGRARDHRADAVRRVRQRGIAQVRISLSRARLRVA